MFFISWTLIQIIGAASWSWWKAFVLMHCSYVCHHWTIYARDTFFYSLINFDLLKVSSYFRLSGNCLVLMLRAFPVIFRGFSVIQQRVWWSDKNDFGSFHFCRFLSTPPPLPNPISWQISWKHFTPQNELLDRWAGWSCLGCPISCHSLPPWLWRWIRGGLVESQRTALIPAHFSPLSAAFQGHFSIPPGVLCNCATTGSRIQNALFQLLG